MKYALVTGGSRGIGRAVCLKLAEMGYPVIVGYCSNENAAREVCDLIAQNGGNAAALQLDVCD
ncbi:MAG: SDR family NAD(P)-dependent oxidoreductase, partial [Kiritimatiellae bacterium]|nr:SDR family NAD(P)-dependent oxidoreductase [Bacteroidales bacterium]MBQ9431064.1 SDR family NAD(P)-dependent oxidoreductase [Kiritimatiellia bacterium]